MGEDIIVSQLDLDRLLENEAWKALIQDLQKRYDAAISVCTGTAIHDQNALVRLSREQGAIEIIELINGWITLTQLEIDERAKEKEEEKDGE